MMQYINDHHHRFQVIINYASSESSALEVCEEIKTRAGEKGAIGVSYTPFVYIVVVDIVYIHTVLYGRCLSMYVCCA